LENEFLTFCQAGRTNWKDLASLRDSSCKNDSRDLSIFNIDKFIDFREAKNPKYFIKAKAFDFLAHIFVSRIKSKAYQAHGVLNIRTLEISWLQVFSPGRDLPLNSVRHLHQEITNIAGHRQEKGIGALTDGEPIEEANALQLIQVFEAFAQRQFPVRNPEPVRNYHSQFNRFDPGPLIFHNKHHIPPIPQFQSSHQNGQFQDFQHNFGCVPPSQGDSGQFSRFGWNQMN